MAVLDSDDVDVGWLVDFAKDWAYLGDAITDQVSNVLDGDYSDINPNAIRAATRLRRHHDDIATAFDSYWASVDEYKKGGLTRSLSE